MIPDFGENQATIDAFHKAYYGGAHTSYYLEWPLWKSPTDMFLYQEIIYTVRPDLIIECGTAFGASALYFANFMVNAGITGRVLSIDIMQGDRCGTFKLPRHERITFLRGASSIDQRVRDVVAERVKDKKAVMVILDSDHRKDHVLAELGAYAGYVTPGSFCVVEDTNVNGHPVAPEHGPGPFEAVEEWLPGHEEFQQVFPYEKYLLSFHHAGWLWRK